MNLTARVGESFRTEFTRQGTVAYAIGMLFFLVIGGLVFQGRLSQGWGMFFSPALFVALPLVDGGRDFWKKLGFGVATYALFYALIFALPDRVGFLSSKPGLRLTFYLVAILAIGLLQSWLMRRLFPTSVIEKPVDDEEISCQ